MSITIVELEQGTEEWLAWRRGRCMASEAPIVMGAAPDWYAARTWDDLRLVKAGLSLPPSEFAEKAFAHGHKLEPIARDFMFPDHSPACISINPMVGEYYGSSLDGINWGDPKLQGDAEWSEIKCPYSGKRSKLYKALLPLKGVDATEEQLRKAILPYVWWQMVHQARTLKGYADKCYLGVWLDEKNNVDIEIPMIFLLKDWPLLKAQWVRFMDGESQGRGDAEWYEAASQWSASNKLVKAAEKDLEASKKTLVRLSRDGYGTEGAGVKVTETERKGGIDFKKMANVFYDGDDFDKSSETFRREGTTTVSVKATTKE